MINIIHHNYINDPKWPRDPTTGGSSVRIRTAEPTPIIQPDTEDANKSKCFHRAEVMQEDNSDFRP